MSSEEYKKSFLNSYKKLIKDKKIFSDNEYIKLLEAFLAEGASIIESKEEEQNINKLYQELKESEKRYKNIVENCPLPIVIHSNSIAKFINPAALKILGLKNQDEILGTNVWSFVDPNYHEEAKKRVDAIYKKKKSVGLLEECFVKKDGTKIFVEVSGTPIEFDGEAASQVIFRDITEIKYLNQKLDFSEKKYRSLFETTSFPILLLKNDLIFDCNQKALDIFELSKARIIGYSISEYFDNKTNDIKTFNDYIKKAISGENIEFEWSFIKNHKEPFFAEVNLNSFKANQETIVVAIINDITEEKQVKIELERIYTKTANPIVIIDSKFNITKTNPAFQAIVGYNSDEIQNKSIYKFIDDADKLKSSIILKNIKNNDFSITEIENKIICKDNSLRWISWNIQQLFYEKSYFLIGHDITSKILTEHELVSAKIKAQEAADLKTAFIANMSHEIRTPLNGIRGFAQLLTDFELPIEKKQRYSTLINSCSDQLLKIVSDIIDISKIDSNQLYINKTEFNLNDELDNILENYKQELINKEKTFIEISLVKSLNNQYSNIVTDQFRLNQILANLLSNAIKFTLKGRIEFGYYKPDSSKILFYVKDTGVGIEKSKLTEIYERFSKSTNSRLIKKQSGTGLGLPLSKGIVELLGGKIWAESEVDIGTTFFFFIDYKKGSVDINKIKDTDFNISNIDWSNKTILIIDDVPLIFHYFKEVLSRTNINILYAENANNALELFRKNPQIDIVFMDIQLPDVNGLELTQVFKVIRNCPIVAQTAYALSGDKEKALKAGCDEYITKPFEKDIVIKTIYKFISN